MCSYGRINRKTTHDFPYLCQYKSLFYLPLLSRISNGKLGRKYFTTHLGVRVGMYGSKAVPIEILSPQ